jgi:hypothetical protein
LFRVIYHLLLHLAHLPLHLAHLLLRLAPLLLHLAHLLLRLAHLLLHLAHLLLHLALLLALHLLFRHQHYPFPLHAALLILLGRFMTLEALTFSALIARLFIGQPNAFVNPLCMIPSLACVVTVAKSPFLLFTPHLTSY